MYNKLKHKQNLKKNKKSFKKKVVDIYIVIVYYNICKEQRKQIRRKQK